MPERSLAARIVDVPHTGAGWGTLLAIGFFLCMGLFGLSVATGQAGGDTFFSNLWLSVPIAAAGASAIGGGVAADVAIIKQGERSLLVVGALLLGLLVGTFLGGELTFPH